MQEPHHAWKNMLRIYIEPLIANLKHRQGWAEQHNSWKIWGGAAHSDRQFYFSMASLFKVGFLYQSLSNIWVQKMGENDQFQNKNFKQYFLQKKEKATGKIWMNPMGRTFQSLYDECLKAIPQAQENRSNREAELRGWNLCPWKRALAPWGCDSKLA